MLHRLTKLEIRSHKLVLALITLITAVFLLAAKRPTFLMEAVRMGNSVGQAAANCCCTGSEHIHNCAQPYVIDYMTETDALALPACVDKNVAADLKSSQVLIYGTAKDSYGLGDSVHVRISLYDGYGKPLNKGGAVLRARMFNIDKEAYATTPITDHGDGTYSAVFRALWAGEATIKVKIAYVPESIRAIYYIRKKLPGTREIQGVFTVKGHSEVTACHPYKDVIRNGSDGKVCNLTGDNSGMPWYCIKPQNIHLLCEDWTGVQILTPNPSLPITACETDLLNRAGQDIQQSIKINVVKMSSADTVTIPLPETPCSKFRTDALWSLKESTGFMFERKWNLLHCKGHDKSEAFQCLRNKRIILFGDSTVRQWFKNIEDRWQCALTTEKTTYSAWHKRCACANTQYNFTVEWLPHSQPFYGGDDQRYTTTSIARHLDETGSHDHAIFVLYLYVHMMGYHHSVFRLKIKKIREAVERLSKRNNAVKFMLKGPHTFTDPPSWERRLSDFHALVYKHILYEEFSGLHDKIIFLDHKDITDAFPIGNPHPPNFVVDSMVDQILDYLC